MSEQCGPIRCRLQPLPLPVAIDFETCLSQFHSTSRSAAVPELDVGNIERYVPDEILSILESTSQIVVYADCFW